MALAEPGRLGVAQVVDGVVALPLDALTREQLEWLADERFDAPEGRGLDVLIRGLSMTLTDARILETTAPLFDGLYAYKARALLLGHEPA